MLWLVLGGLLGVAVVVVSAAVAVRVARAEAAGAAQTAPPSTYGADFGPLDMRHFGQGQRVGVSVAYAVDPAGTLVDIVAVETLVRRYLEQYPRDQDYWERVAAGLCCRLQEVFHFAQGSLVLEVAPTADAAFVRRATCALGPGQPHCPK